MENVLVAVTEETRNATDTVFVIIEGDEFQISLTDAGLSFENSDSEIFDRLIPVVQEAKGIDISGLYKINRATGSKNIFIIPNSTAG